ncbi:MAG: alpha/beta hydrolase [Bacteroides sp.]
MRIRMRRLVIYVHGKGGNADEAKHYQTLFTGSDVIGFDYKSQNPWEAKREFSGFYDLHSKGYDSVILIANSIGAFFSMSSLAEKKISQAMFISPIVNMEKLITDMMMWSNVTEAELQSQKEIPTEFGETLSWEYLCYVRENPIVWSVPTCILYGGKDTLTSRETISEFADSIGATLTVMEDGEHWFHTDVQMKVLDNWICNSIQ